MKEDYKVVVNIEYDIEYDIDDKSKLESILIPEENQQKIVMVGFINKDKLKDSGKRTSGVDVDSKYLLPTWVLGSSVTGSDFPLLILVFLVEVKK